MSTIPGQDACSATWGQVSGAHWCGGWACSCRQAISISPSGGVRGWRVRYWHWNVSRHHIGPSNSSAITIGSNWNGYDEYEDKRHYHTKLCLPMTSRLTGNTLI